MNPNKPALSRPDQLTRAAMIARTLGVGAFVGYLRRMHRPDQLQAVLAFRDTHGTQEAAKAMQAAQWSLEAALLTLCGPAALERHFSRLECV